MKTTPQIVRSTVISLCIVVLLSLSHSTFAQFFPSNCSWPSSYAGNGEEGGNSIAIDTLGNTYLTGYYMGTYMHVGLNSLFPTGASSCFLVKHDKSRNVLWVKNVADNSHNISPQSTQIATDAAGNIYMTGTFQTLLSFGPNVTIAGNGSYTYFIAKFDTNGNILWAQSIPIGIGSSQDKLALATDNLGSVYVTGYFKSTTLILGSTTLTKVGGSDYFIAKYDGLGNVLWAKSAGTAESNNGAAGKSITVDSQGNVCVLGDFNYSSLIVGSTTLANALPTTSFGSNDCFLIKYSTLGNLLWAKSIGGTSEEKGNSICSDLNNNFYVAGATTSATFNVGSTTLTANGNSDILVAKFNSAGNAVFAKRIGGSSNEAANAIAADPIGNIYAGGYFSSTSLNFGGASTTITNLGGKDFFLVKYDSLANTVWAKQYGGVGLEEIKSIVGTKRINNIYYTGIISNTISNDALFGRDYDFEANLTVSPASLLCYGDSSGVASINAVGDGFPYTYQWSTGDTTQTITSIPAGSYSVMVKDNEGCNEYRNFSITEPASPLTVYVDSMGGNSCSGICSGVVSSFAQGGTGSFHYTWSANAGGQTTSSIYNLCPDRYTVTVKDDNNCSVTKSISVGPSTTFVDPNIYLTNLAAVDQINVSPSFAAYYTYSLPSVINPPASNPHNFVDPGKKARFKVECTNKKMNGQSIVSGICKVRTNSPYVTITDSSSALNNIGWNNKAWSADEFEIDIDPNTPPGTNAYIDFIVQESGQNYFTTCIAIPITPLAYTQTSPLTIDDDNNPDSQGNDNDMCEPGETIEFYPWLNNVSNLNAEYVRGRFLNLDNHSFINIWNGVTGVNTTVYDATWWNFAFAQPQTISAGSMYTTPEYDFVFDYNTGGSIANFNLYMVMAGGFKLFSETALSLVQWSLPYEFGSNVTAAEKNVNENTFTIYPNPSNGSFNIAAKGQQIQQVKIYNQIGELVYSVYNPVVEINLSAYAKGMYFMEAQVDGKIINKKISIQ